MTCRSIVFAALCFAGVVSIGSAQNTAPMDRSPGVPAATAPDDNRSGVLPPATGPTKPGMRPARPHYPSSPLSYQSTPLNYPSNEPKPRNRQIDANGAAAQRQSGLNRAEATSLITTRGYSRVGEVQADPNSIWVWQADAMKNGRRVRLGIDNHGHLLEISNGQPQPCTTPGAGLGAGPMGVGARLSGVTSCSGR